MAKAIDVKSLQKGPVKKVKSTSVKWEFPLNKKNGMYLAISVGVILLGYILMAMSITNDPAHLTGKWNSPLAIDVAPILLVIGYCFLIPYSIMKFFGKSENSDKPN